jgi:hypothetical protein
MLYIKPVTWHNVFMVIETAHESPAAANVNVLIRKPNHEPLRKEAGRTP